MSTWQLINQSEIQSQPVNDLQTQSVQSDEVAAIMQQVRRLFSSAFSTTFKFYKFKFLQLNIILPVIKVGQSVMLSGIIIYSSV